MLEIRNNCLGNESPSLPQTDELKEKGGTRLAFSPLRNPDREVASRFCGRGGGASAPAGSGGPGRRLGQWSVVPRAHPGPTRVWKRVRFSTSTAAPGSLRLGFVSWSFSILRSQSFSLLMSQNPSPIIFNFRGNTSAICRQYKH